MNQRREDGVDAGSEEYRSGDNEEVLENKEDEIVGVDFGGQTSGDVADDFEQETDGKCDEIPRPVAENLPDVGDEEDEKNDVGEEGERE